MYIIVSDTKRKVGFKGLEVSDIVVGLPLFIILLLLFSFENLRMIALILLVIAVFMFLPISLSKKNRMYKVIFLTLSYFNRTKKYIYFKKEKEGKIDGIFKRYQIKELCR